MEIRWKYIWNKPSPPRRAGKLGEIHQNHISTYFTKRSEVYLNCISTVFLFNYFTEPAFRRQAKRSLFPLYFHHISFLLFPRARSGYFYSISIVFLVHQFPNWNSPGPEMPRVPSGVKTLNWGTTTPLEFCCGIYDLVLPWGEEDALTDRSMDSGSLPAGIISSLTNWLLMS